MNAWRLRSMLLTTGAWLGVMASATMWSCSEEKATTSLLTQDSKHGDAPNVGGSVLPTSQTADAAPAQGLSPQGVTSAQGPSPKDTSPQGSSPSPLGSGNAPDAPDKDLSDADAVLEGDRFCKCDRSAVSERKLSADRRARCIKKADDERAQWTKDNPFNFLGIDDANRAWDEAKAACDKIAKDEAIGISEDLKECRKKPTFIEDECAKGNLLCEKWIEDIRANPSCDSCPASNVCPRIGTGGAGEICPSLNFGSCSYYLNPEDESNLFSPLPQGCLSPVRSGDQVKVECHFTMFSPVSD